MPQLNKWLTDYQDAYQADSMLKVQSELDETKIVLHKTIESLLERGEKIDNLVERSNQLSGASKQFYKQVRYTCYYITTLWLPIVTAVRVTNF